MVLGIMVYRGGEAVSGADLGASRPRLVVWNLGG